MRDEIIELVPAFTWNCPACHSEQIEKAVVVELSQDEVDSLCQERAINPETLADFVSAPAVVQCKTCGHQYKTTNFEDYE